jgi:LmbE family N-acetylglucosaminyl deacetylase
MNWQTYTIDPLEKRTERKSVLAVGAHPDDLEFGCSLIVRNLARKGYDAYYIIATNGENGCKKNIHDRKKRIALRKKEQIKAAKKTGVHKVIFLDYRDGFLEYNDKLRKGLTHFIKKIKPEIVFTFDPANTEFTNLNLFHRDHRNIALAVFDACFAAKNDFIYPDKNGLHSVKKLYFFGTNKPDYHFDITKNIELKLDILGSHESQFSNFDEFKKFYKKNLANSTKKYKYTEAFRTLEVVKIT